MADKTLRELDETFEDIEVNEITGTVHSEEESDLSDYLGEKTERELNLGETPKEETETNLEEISDEASEAELDEEDEGWDFDLEELEVIDYPTKSAVGAGKEASDLRVVNSKTGGKRLVLKPRVLEELELEETVGVGQGDGKIILGKSRGPGSYKLKKQGKHYMIYNSNLVKDVTKILELDFENCSSRNLEVRYVDKEGSTYLVARKERE